MSTPWPVDELVAHARAALLTDGAVHDGFSAADVSADDDALRVTFAWRDDPKRYAVRLPLPGDPPTSPWTGEPVTSALEWAGDVHGLLMEELATGFVRRARRTPGDGVVELAYPAPWIEGTPDFYLSGVPLYPGAGDWLARIGLDISAPAQAYAEDRMISWVQASLNRPPDNDLGHAALSWAPTEPTGPGRPSTAAPIAQLDALQTAKGVPPTVAHALAHQALHEAAEAGATTVTTTLIHPALADLGFRPTADGRMDCDVTAVRPLSLADWRFPVPSP